MHGSLASCGVSTSILSAPTGLSQVPGIPECLARFCVAAVTLGPVQDAAIKAVYANAQVLKHVSFPAIISCECIES